MKLTRVLMVLGVLLLAVGFVGVPVVMDADGATVIEEFSCVIIPDDSGLPIYLFSTDSHQLMTPSGNVKLTCHFVIPEEFIPANTMHHEGFVCGTEWGYTEDTWSVTATDGTVLLRCQIKPPKE